MPGDDDFPLRVADRLAALPGALAVQLGGSRAHGTSLPDSDWDFALYYRGHFDVDHVRRLGWPGVVTELGGWGQVMNGGAWLTVEGRPVDIHYRDLGSIESLLTEVAEGRFEVHRAPFYVAGIPTYLPLAELALGKTLHGQLPVPTFPEQLRSAASAWWKREAELDLGHARSQALSRNVVISIGLLARVILEEGHRRLCATSRWITNEKRLISEADLHAAASALVHSRTGDLALVGTIGDLLSLHPFAAR